MSFAESDTEKEITKIAILSTDKSMKTRFFRSFPAADASTLAFHHSAQDSTHEYSIWDVPQMASKAFLKGADLVFVLCNAPETTSPTLPANFLPAAIRAETEKASVVILLGDATTSPRLTPEALRTFAEAMRFNVASMVDFTNVEDIKAVFKLGIDTLTDTPSISTAPLAAATTATSPIMKKTFPEAWDALYEAGGLRALLEDYVKKGSGSYAFFRGHWNHHHTKALRELLSRVEPISDITADNARLIAEIYSPSSSFLTRSGESSSLVQLLLYYHVKSGIAPPTATAASAAAAPTLGVGSSGAASGAGGSAADSTADYSDSDSDDSHPDSDSHRRPGK